MAHSGSVFLLHVNRCFPVFVMPLFLASPRLYLYCTLTELNIIHRITFQKKEVLPVFSPVIYLEIYTFMNLPF